MHESFAVLDEWLLPDEAMPPGHREDYRQTISNRELAATLYEPDRVQLIVSRKRLTGIEQDVRGPAGDTQVVHIYLALYADDAAARDEVVDPISDAGFAGVGALQGAQLHDVPTTSLGERTAVRAFRFTNDLPDGGDLYGVGIRFAYGCVSAAVVGISESGPLSFDVVRRLAVAVESRLSRLYVPLPNLGSGELLSAQADPLAVLHDAFKLLWGLHYRHLLAADLLLAAYQGARAHLGLTKTSSADPAIASTDPDRGWHEFLAAYRTLGEDIESSACVYAAAEAMFAGLDGHTAFLNPRQFRTYATARRGDRRMGLGITVSPRPPRLILKVRPESPAEVAGLRPGDRVIAIGGQTLAPSSHGRIRPYDYGADEEAVPVTVDRHGRQLTIAVDLASGRSDVGHVWHRRLPNRLGYIELDDIPQTRSTIDSLATAITNLESAEVRGYVLDLRHNGGGWSTTMCEIAGMFLGDGALMTTHQFDDGRIWYQHSRGACLIRDVAVAVLIGSATASAAEILAESLRGHRGAVLVGSPTSGCVNGGRCFPLLDGSAVRIAEFEFLVGPANRKVEGVGVLPDHDVAVSSEALQSGADPQLAAAMSTLP